MIKIELPDEMLQTLVKANNVAVLTGAGISAESGIQTFRDPQGLWAKFNPVELASMDGFMSNPNLVWDWYQYRREIISKAKPNPGHIAIAEMKNLFPKFTLITQNVDRLHQRAGSDNVIELHGNIVENYCVSCNTPFLENIDFENKELPKCKKCGGLIRPNVVWFGEMLPYDALQDANSVAETADFFFSIGTSAEVYPAANLPIIAKNHGAYVVEINPNATSISGYMNQTFNYPAGEVLPLFINDIKKIKGEK